MMKAEKVHNSCDLGNFVKVIAEKFGMGYDYALKDRQGKPLKSWFTLQEALTAVSESGYELSERQAKSFLTRLVNRKKFERKGELFRRCAFLPFKFMKHDDFEIRRHRSFRRNIDWRLSED